MLRNFKNFVKPENSKLQMNEFPDLDHIDGVSISTVSAEL